MVEAKWSSILKSITVVNHLFLKDTILKSVFINPLAKGVEQLYRHVPIGKLESADLFDSNLSNKYYNILLNYNSGIRIHYEEDEKRIINENVEIGNTPTYSPGFEENIVENINVFFNEESSLLGLLDSKNVGLIEDLKKRILNENALFSQYPCYY